MFRLHEQTRTFLCRLSFLMLGLMPTCATIVWAVLWNRPSYQQQLAAEFGDRLGLIVECRRASHPLPNCTRYEGVVFRDPETKHELARTELLTISTNDKAIHIASPTSVFCEWQAWQRLLNQFQQRLHSGRVNERRLHLSFAEIHLQGLLPQQHNITLYKFNAVDGVTDQGRDVVAGFCSDPNDQKPTTIHLKRIVAQDPHTLAIATPRTRIQITTGTSPLPCVLIGGPKSAATLGNFASFHGVALLDEAGQSSYLTLRGIIFEIDLDKLVAQPFSQRLTGLAQIECDSLVISDGRVVNFSGRFNAGPGEISCSLAKSLSRSWGLKELVQLDDQAMVLQYNQFACKMKWQDGLLELRGDCPEHRAVMLTAGPYAVWGEPTGPIGSPATLLQAFATNGIAQVPALPSVGYLLQWLPPAPATPVQQNHLAERSTAQQR